ncbi:MAG TPA: arginase family protein [Capillimicrobium sp.]
MTASGWELVGIPYTSMARAGGIADAIGVLRSAGLAERLARLGVPDGGDLELLGPDGTRGPSGLLSEPALAMLFERTRARVAEVRARGRRPLLVGGDCPVVLGALAALRDAGARPGLLMLDGHEDAWPPHASQTGEASDSEVAIALGRVPALPAPLGEAMPVLDASAIAMIGPRDRDEIEGAGVASLRDEVAFFADGRAALAGHAGEMIAAARGALDADALWLHVDLDVLREDALAAVDYPQPGGLPWARLDELAAAAAREPECAGVSVVIYNPELDPDRSGARSVAGFVARLAGAH